MPPAPESHVNDGIIVGKILSRPKRCPRCNKMTRCVEIAGAVLPPEVTAESTILWDRRHGGLLGWIGIGCGDYAKFHRQVVHIQEKVSRGPG